MPARNDSYDDNSSSSKSDEDETDSDSDSDSNSRECGLWICVLAVAMETTSIELSAKIHKANPGLSLFMQDFVRTAHCRQ